MLPNKALAKVYDEIVWFYVFRDFSDSRADRLAQRVELRFGVTSYPQIFLADPETLAILKHTGREVGGFLNAVATTHVDKANNLDSVEKSTKAYAILDRLESRPKEKLARRCLGHDDIVVRYRALEILAKTSPESVVREAEELLKIKNDPFRFRVCEVLGKAASTKAAPALERLVKDPKDSLNPNVLRIRAVQALATCGNARSIEFIAPHAQTGKYFNGLTGVAVDTLAAIGRRHPKAKGLVNQALRSAYPEPADPSKDRDVRACVGLAKRIYRALGEKRPFPATYDAAARRRLMTPSSR